MIPRKHILQVWFYGLLAAACMQTAFAQKTKKYMIKYSTVGFGGGSSHYFGDLATYTRPFRAMYKTPRWNGTVNYTRHLSQDFAIRGAFSWIRLVGDDFTFNTNFSLNNSKVGTSIPTSDLNRFFRNAHFRNDLKELSLVAQYNFFKTYHRSASNRPNVMPYVFGGLAMFITDPQAKVRWPEFNKNPVWVSLRQYNTEAQNVNGGLYPNMAFSLPMGLGVRWKIKNGIDLTAEGGYRLSKYDYIDDVGNDWGNPVDIANSAASTDFNIPVPNGMINPNIIIGQPANLSTLGILLSNRSLEATAARTNRDRGTAYAAAVGGTTVPVTEGFFDPSSQQTGYKADGTKLGRNRSGGMPDTYFVFQVSLHFILNAGVKCPTIK